MHLLIVEDDPRLSRAVQRVLEEEGHVVDLVEDGPTATMQSELETYDVVVLDVMLPGYDGYEVVKRMRARGDLTPVLMLTARDGIRDRVQGLDAGADDYMPKPFAVSELLARIRALGRRSSSAGGTGEPDILRVSNLELNLRSRQAKRGGEAVDLTAREFALLETLMRHAGQVLTRTQLLDQVWNFEMTAESNVVDIYVHYLRNKIDKAHDVKLIQTVRGAGYRLKAD